MVHGTILEFISDHVFDVGLGVLSILVGWIWRMTWKEIDSNRIQNADLRCDIQKLELLVAGSYVTRMEFTGFCVTLFNKLDHIADKLDTKLDKNQAH